MVVTGTPGVVVVAIVVGPRPVDEAEPAGEVTGTTELLSQEEVET